MSEIKRDTLDALRLANDHWEWVVRWLEMVYKDAFIHGYKHGIQTMVKQQRVEEHIDNL